MTPIPILDSGTWLLLEAIVSGIINLRVFSAKFILGKWLTLKSSLDSFDGDAAKCETLV